MAYGLRPTADAKGRLRGRMSMSLSVIAIARIQFLAKQQGLSASRVVEMLVGEVDYQQMFKLFAQRLSLGHIVIATGQPPALVRALYNEYRADLYEKERAVTPPRTLPVRSVPRRLRAAD